jgi:fermentation-respiration switch protein FrsA (DUF1100 family)
MKKAGFLLIDLFSIATIFFFLLFVLSIFVGYMVMKPDRVNIDNLPSDYQLEFEDVTFINAKDGVVLKGWWIPSSRVDFISQKAVIFSHSYGDNRQRMPIQTLKLARRLSSEGYHVFMYDFRNSGESGGDYTTIGARERSDLQSAIQYVHQEKGMRDIALIGWSMGAAVSIIVGSESPYVKAVIADSPFADLQEYSYETISYWTGVPKQAGKMIVKFAEIIFVDLNLSEIKPYVAAQNYYDKGLLLIHSEKDGAISYKQSQLIYDNALNAEFWLTHKGGHIRNYKHQKKVYEDRVVDFLGKYISDKHYFKIADDQTRRTDIIFQ